MSGSRRRSAADGSDAMNKDADYSAAYVVLAHRRSRPGGFGFTFTIGRGNDLCVAAAQQRAQPAHRPRRRRASSPTSAASTAELQSDSQLRWLGPEKGVVHLALAAVMNAVWDLAARVAGQPLWRLLTEMTPGAAGRRRRPALSVRRPDPRRGAWRCSRELGRPAETRIAELERTGYPCYTT